MGFDVAVDRRLGHEQPAANLDVDHLPRDPVRRSLADAQALGEFGNRDQLRAGGGFRSRCPHGAQNRRGSLFVPRPLREIVADATSSLRISLSLVRPIGVDVFATRARRSFSVSADTSSSGSSEMMWFSRASRACCATMADLRRVLGKRPAKPRRKGD